MLRSHVAYAARGKVILRKEILAQLGIGPDGILYGAYCREEKSLILSPIPPECWQKALKVIIHTREKPGSLAMAARAIAEDEGFSTISSWASLESTVGHLSATSIVVPERGKNKGIIGPEELQDRLNKKLFEIISDLPQYRNKLLFPVRVTQLSILDAYGKMIENRRADFHYIRVEQHTLRLDQSREIMNGQENSDLWNQLVRATSRDQAEACILTPDTEEAFMRIVAVPYGRGLISLSFNIDITSQVSSFAGYWDHALELIKDFDYSIYSAHNLIISKSVDSPEENKERAEFYFLLDSTTSKHVTKPLAVIETSIESELSHSFIELANRRSDKVKISNVHVRRPKGVGIPCFFACNAQEGDIVGLQTAIKLCRTLESYGFKPVNVEFGNSSILLVNEVRELIEACRFMLVLHCRNTKLELKNPSDDYGSFATSQWVHFEAWEMTKRQDANVIMLSFKGLPTRGPDSGRVEISIPEVGMDDDLEKKISKRIQAWRPKASRMKLDGIEAPEISDKVWEHDLIDYYEGLLEYTLKE